MEFELTTRFSSPAELFAFASALHGHTSGNVLESMFQGDLTALPAPVAAPAQHVYAEAAPVQQYAAYEAPAPVYAPQPAYATAPVYAPQPAPAPVQQPIQAFPQADLATVKQTVAKHLMDKAGGFTVGQLAAWAQAKGVAFKSFTDIPPQLYGECVHWLQSGGWRR
jgi:hypothetical protein